MEGSQESIFRLQAEPFQHLFRLHAGLLRRFHDSLHGGLLLRMQDLFLLGFQDSDSVLVSLDLLVDLSGTLSRSTIDLRHTNNTFLIHCLTAIS